MTLNSNDNIYKLIKSEPNLKSLNRKALPKWQQGIFTELHGLSGINYQIKLKELRVKWR